MDKGIIDFQDGRYYIGGIKNQKMHGLGMLRKNGFVKYEGNFIDGKIQGFGKMH